MPANAALDRRCIRMADTTRLDANTDLAGAGLLHRSSHIGEFTGLGDLDGSVGSAHLSVLPTGNCFATSLPQAAGLLAIYFRIIGIMQIGRPVLLGIKATTVDVAGTPETTGRPSHRRGSYSMKFVPSLRPKGTNRLAKDALGRIDGPRVVSR